MKTQVTTVMSDTYSKGRTEAISVKLLKIEQSPIEAFFVLSKKHVYYDENVRELRVERTATVFFDAKEAMINALNMWSELIMTYQDEEEPTPQEDDIPW